MVVGCQTHFQIFLPPTSVLAKTKTVTSTWVIGPLIGRGSSQGLRNRSQIQKLLTRSIKFNYSGRTRFLACPAVGGTLIWPHKQPSEVRLPAIAASVAVAVVMSIAVVKCAVLSPAPLCQLQPCCKGDGAALGCGGEEDLPSPAAALRRAGVAGWLVRWPARTWWGRGQG